MIKIFKTLSFILLLTLLQVIYIPPSLSQIRPEELTESVRNVFLLDHGHFIPRNASLVGYYLPLQIIYHLFGFSFATAKLLHLGLATISLVCLVLLLKKSRLPLITIAFSPTLLFFNTLSVQYGMDIEYAIILIFLALQSSKLVNIAFWIIFTIALNSYAGFLILAPSLVILFFHKKPLIKNFLIATITIAVTFLLLNLQFKGSFPKLAFEGSKTFAPSQALATLQGFTGLHDNYYYEVANPDFSNLYPLLAVIATLGLVFWSFKSKKYRFAIALCVLTIFINLVVLSTISSVTGPVMVRRAAGIIMAFYTFYIIAWSQAFTIKTKYLRFFIIFILLLLPLHHIISYYPNYLGLKNPSQNREEFWFNLSGNPQESLNSLTHTLQNGNLNLKDDFAATSFYYAYNTVYSTVTANCEWNHIKCHQITAYDPHTNSFIPLDYPTMYKIIVDFQKTQPYTTTD